MSKCKGNRRNKGFTLVEVIIVLVILAILAAILIPSMIGWIDKANGKKVVAEARGIYLAAQGAVSEQYGLNKSFGKENLRYKYNGEMCGRVSNNMLYRVQNNDVGDLTSNQKVDEAIAKSALQFLDSADKNTAEYKFLKKTAPTTQTVEDYEKLTGQPGMVIFYNGKAKVVKVEFGHDGYLCRIAGGKVDIEKNGKFTNSYTN